MAGNFPFPGQVAGLLWAQMMAYLTVTGPGNPSPVTHVAGPGFLVAANGDAPPFPAAATQFISMPHAPEVSPARQAVNSNPNAAARIDYAVRVFKFTGVSTLFYFRFVFVCGWTT